MKKHLALFLLFISIGCSKEVDKVTVVNGKLEDGSFTINNAKPTEFWADIDVAYIGNVSLIYDIKVLDNDSIIYECTDDALKVNVKMFSSTKTINDNVQTSYQGKMKCEFVPARTGTFKIKINQDQKGNFQKIIKSDLIIKQLIQYRTEHPHELGLGKRCSLRSPRFSSRLCRALASYYSLLKYTKNMILCV
jgi:hypothetical protein